MSRTHGLRPGVGDDDPTVTYDAAMYYPPRSSYSWRRWAKGLKPGLLV